MVFPTEAAFGGQTICTETDGKNMPYRLYFNLSESHQLKVSANLHTIASMGHFENVFLAQFQALKIPLAVSLPSKIRY